MILICTIMVMFSVGNMTFITKEDLTGTFIAESNGNYLGDFSKDAEEHGYIGYDYSRVKVKKDNCVRH